MTTPDLVCKVEVAPSYRVGYPMPIAATIENPLPQRTYFALPFIDRFDMPPPLELVLVRVGERDGQLLPAKTPGAHEGEPHGFRLGPGEARRMLLDMAELDPRLEAGEYELRARYLAPPISADANPVRFTVELPGEDEAAAVARLRATNTSRSPSWNAFLLENFREIERHELEHVPAAQHLRLRHMLTLHWASYGPHAPARLPPNTFDGAGDGPLVPELLALTHELALARGDATVATLEARLLAGWPGMAWRIEANREGDGVIARLRRIAGAERAYPPVPVPLPYAGATP